MMSWCEGVSATDINRVGSVKGQDVALFPPPERLQPLAKLDRGAAQAGPAVRAACLAARQDLPGLGEVSGLVAKEEGPEVDIDGDFEGREGGRVRHCGFVSGGGPMRHRVVLLFVLCLLSFVFFSGLEIELMMLNASPLSCHSHSSSPPWLVVGQEPSPPNTLFGSARDGWHRLSNSRMLPAEQRPHSGPPSGAPNPA